MSGAINRDGRTRHARGDCELAQLMAGGQWRRQPRLLTMRPKPHHDETFLRSALLLPGGRRFRGRPELCTYPWVSLGQAIAKALLRFPAKFLAGLRTRSAQGPGAGAASDEQ